jgi:hypothetical protein
MYGIPEAAVSTLLAYDGCFNVAVGAWLLRKRTNEAAGDFWYGIGRYHSAAKPDRNRYILRVHRIMVGMVNAKKNSARKGVQRRPLLVAVHGAERHRNLDRVMKD